MKNLLLSVIGCLFAEAVFPQEFIQGKVVDLQNGSSIPYASISLLTTEIGTATDEDGYFMIKLDAAVSGKKIIVSSLGYSNKLLSVDSLIQTGKTVLIGLSPDVQILSEIVIKANAVDPLEVIKEALEVIPNNYSQKPFNMEFYSKVTVYDSLVILYEVESIVLTYRNGYTAEAHNISKVIQKRDRGRSPLPPISGKDKKEYFPFLPHMAIGLADRIGSGRNTGLTIFNPGSLRKFNFRFAGVKHFDKDTVIAIEYSTGNLSKGGETDDLTRKYNGMIYIAANNLAIIRHTLKIGSQLHDIFYKRQDDKYFPYYIRTKNETGNKKIYTITHEISLRRIMNSPTILTNDPGNWYYEDVPYDEDYWRLNFPFRGYLHKTFSSAGE